MTVLLEVEGLTKTFPVRRSLGALLARRRPVLHALTDVSLRVRRGETLGVVGESGCGKSTLARCLVRLHEADRGRIAYDGQDVRGLRGASRRAYNRRVQMVFQDPYGSLNPRLTVRAALAEALRVHRMCPPGEIGARVAALLDLVHLPRDAAERRPHQFSGGQRQRIGIARALAVEPECLIADELVSALDVSVQAQMVNLLLELQQRLHLTVIFIAHDLRLVRHLSHRVAVMYLGRVVELAPTETLFSDPRHPYTQALLRAAPELDPARRSTVDAVRGELPSPLAPPPGCAFHPRCPAAIGICRQVVPPLAPLRDGRLVACHVAAAQDSGDDVSSTLIGRVQPAATPRDPPGPSPRDRTPKEQRRGYGRT
jgi:oligopeptide transport system ATP-binding protein